MILAINFGVTIYDVQQILFILKYLSSKTSRHCLNPRNIKNFLKLRQGLQS